jgi:hypothetical protein
VVNVLAGNSFGDNLGDGVASPIALLIIVLLVIAVVFLLRNMNARLKRLHSRFPDGTGSFDPPSGPAAPANPTAPAKPQDDRTP